MSARCLKWIRVVAALVVFGGLTVAFVDFRGLLPWRVGHWLAEIQFVPSLVALLTGATLSIACVIIMIVTLVCGRIYCSAICPLGILQDVVLCVAGWFRRYPRPMTLTRSHAWLRQTVLWATLLAAVFGWGSFATTLVDPYSNFGRIASGLFRPIVALVNNSLVGQAEQLGWHWLYRVEPQWSGLGVLSFSIILLALLIVMTVIAGRLYCNTLCPVGTLLGWLAKHSIFRLAIDQSACSKCASCLRACKAHCIDLRSCRIDFSRCVACYNCVTACNDHGIGYQFAWTRKSSRGTANRSDLQTAVLGVADPQLRAFIAQTVVGITAAGGLCASLLADDKRRDANDNPDELDKRYSPVICPPGSSGVETFLDRCTACHLCVSACPTGVLRPAFMEYGLVGLMKPRMDFARSFCNFDCRRCGEVCPDGAICLPDLETKQVTKIGEVAFFRDKCVVVTNGTDCAACSEHCPTKAVFTTPHGDNLRLPEVNADLCIGCGACEHACPVKPDKAIVVQGLREHGVGRKSIEPKAVAPESEGDFPF